jgi:23S rRNA (guanosine2251-2'-O)-methyltransferase
MRRLVRERCDFLARLPTRPQQPTLNVASAAAVALYELVRASLLPGT